MKNKRKFTAIIILVVMVLAGLWNTFSGDVKVDDFKNPSELVSVIETLYGDNDNDTTSVTVTESTTINTDEIYENGKGLIQWNGDVIPEYEDVNSPFVAINDNVPYFIATEISKYSTQYGYEYYSPLDKFGRCGVTMSLVGYETMPTEKRGDISSVYPTGWEQNKYDKSLVDGCYIYNRAHLQGFQLTAENANECNLITGTRYFNVEGMLPFENMVADYVKETNNHVLYRVTPVFEGDNLLAYGVVMEAYSIEDSGEELSYCVFVYNIQPGITIDYSTGENWIK